MVNLLSHLSDTQQQFQLLRSVARLKQHSEFEHLVEALQATLTTLDHGNRTALSPGLEWNQGAAQFLSELLQTIGEAETIARDIEKQSRPRETQF